MKANTRKEKRIYTQGKQCAARVLLIAGLLVSYSPRNILAAPDSQLSMAPGASPVEGNLFFQARAGESVRFFCQDGQWRAKVSSHIGDFSRQVVLPVVCSSGEDVASILEILSRYPSLQSKRQIHVLDRNVCPTLGEVLYVGELGLKGGGNDLSSADDPLEPYPDDEDEDDRDSKGGNSDDGGPDDEDEDDGGPDDDADADDGGPDDADADDGGPDDADADDGGPDDGGADDGGPDDGGADDGGADGEDPDDECLEDYFIP